VRRNFPSVTADVIVPTFTKNVKVGQPPGNHGGCVDQPERWCDNLSNNDPFVFGLASKASAYVTLKMANHVFKANQP
jgi:hypothetical protein